MFAHACHQVAAQDFDELPEVIIRRLPFVVFECPDEIGPDARSPRKLLLREQRGPAERPNSLAQLRRASPNQATRAPYLLFPWNRTLGGNDFRTTLRALPNTKPLVE